MAGVREDLHKEKSERFKGWQDLDPFLLAGSHMESMRRNVGSLQEQRGVPRLTGDREMRPLSYNHKEMNLA